MEPWPADRTNRSRSGQRGSAGSNFRNFDQSTNATSAAPMGSPGWPDLAFSTPSTDSILMVLTARRDRSMRSSCGLTTAGSDGRHSTTSLNVVPDRGAGIGHNRAFRATSRAIRRHRYAGRIRPVGTLTGREKAREGSMTTQTVQAPDKTKVEKVDRVVVRLAGDSGDGIQLSGNQLTTSSAIAGNDLSTLPDFPAEIRAPAGTLPGVSGFQISFSSYDIHTPGDT